jgi:hypothetical protein
MRGDRTALTRGGAAWVGSRGSGVVGHWFPCGQIDWGPLWLIENLVDKILSTGIARRHANM